MWQRIRTLWAILCLGLALTIAPAAEAVKHGPGAMVAEAEHLAYHAERGDGHEMPLHHHDYGDHDHVSVVILVAPPAVLPPMPDRTLRPAAMAADSVTRDGPKRPPRPTVI
jgi:hypothetical protein